MTQRERDRLVALKKAGKKLITQKQADQQIGLSERQCRRLLAKLRGEGGQARNPCGGQAAGIRARPYATVRSVIRPLKRCLTALPAVLITLAALPLPAQQPSIQETFSPGAIRFFENEVRPVLLTNCSSCHNAKLLTSGLSLESREDIVKGGNRGEAVSPGLPEESRLIHAVRQQGPLKMPPGGKLAPQEISALARWIEMRLPWPSQSALAPSAGQNLQPLVVSTHRTPRRATSVRHLLGP